ncbi:MAG: UDP-N-acetylglucosamine 2-epimerase (hydrolyzing) [Bacteroidetes bacterium]|nr:UDP-N-acetylglucosamine 2-epimerase (hydrolyzing) [Bacteroidota bacterium]
MRKIVFLTGTRADFGKLKSLMEIVEKSHDFDIHIFATGMHLNEKYGHTVDEIKKCGYANIHSYVNHHDYDSMDSILAKTIEGFSVYIKQLAPDLIVIHGDRVEALAGAIVGAMNNILVAHIEGGEVSGTIDEHVRHAVSKMSHVHFVANPLAKTRLIQMGEEPESIFIIGSPDVDVMLSDKLPDLKAAKAHYNIEFEHYGIVMFHPVTTEIDHIGEQANSLVDALLESGKNYVVVFPNNDLGSDHILEAYERLKGHQNFCIFPSLRFEYFLVLLKNAECMIGNSSAGIREAPYYGIPTINIGSRQNNRSDYKSIVHAGYGRQEILDAIVNAGGIQIETMQHFGDGNSDQLFLAELKKDSFWAIPKQKYFIDLSRETI